MWTHPHSRQLLLSEIFFQHKKTRYPYVLSKLIFCELLYLRLKYKENMVQNKKIWGKINNDENYWKENK